jgi:hypothetical protein
MFLRSMKLHSCEGQKLLRDLPVVQGKRKDCVLLEYERPGVGYRLGGLRMSIVDLKSENVTWKIECANLSSPVGENLVATNCACNDLVKVLGRLILTKYLGIALVPHQCASPFDQTGRAYDRRSALMG